MGIKPTEEAAAAQKRARCILWLGPRQKQRERKGRRSVLVTDNEPRMRRERAGESETAGIGNTAYGITARLPFGLCILCTRYIKSEESYPTWTSKPCTPSVAHSEVTSTRVRPRVPVNSISASNSAGG